MGCSILPSREERGALIPCKIMIDTHWREAYVVYCRVCTFHKVIPKDHDSKPVAILNQLGWRDQEGWICPYHE